ncbi:MAG TPA: cupredoxin family copper-binding protein [Candidatus Saccharimonadales bacterium]|nr:cupredoxin family copper-binding protein [Candidatus Saccharimonadales bacterium]
MKKVVVAVVIGVAIVVAIVLVTGNKASAPSETSNSHKSNSNSSQNQTSTNSNSSNTSATNTVAISSYSFSPGDITVKAGTTVTWTNEDAVAHTVTETDGQDGPKSGELNQGQSYSFTFNTPGTYKYNCSIHPYMTGTVTVTD